MSLSVPGNALEQNIQGLPPFSRYVLVRWFCIVSEHATELLRGAVASRVVGAMSTLLQYLVQEDDAKLYRHARRVVVSAMGKVPELRTELSMYVKSAEPSVKLLGALGCLIPPKQLRNDEVQAEAATVCLDVFLQGVLVSKEPASGEVLTRSVATLISSLDSRLFTHKLLPAISKVMKRNPEPAMPTVVFILRTVTVDLSDCLADIQDMLLAAAKHTKLTVRGYAVDAYSQLAFTFKQRDSTAVNLLVGPPLAALIGPAGKVTAAGDRTTMYQILCSVGKQMSSGVGVASSTCDALIGLFKEEKVDDVRLQCLLTMRIWCEKLSGAPPKGLLPLLKSLLTGKDALRSAAMDVWYAAGKSSDMVTQMSEYVAPLMSIAKAALTKPAQRGEGAIALYLISVASASDMKAEEETANEKVWATMLKPDSALLSVANALRLPAKDADALCSLVESLILDHSRDVHHFSMGPQVHTLAVGLALHPVGRVRRMACTSLRRICQAKPQSWRDLVHGLRSFEMWHCETRRLMGVNEDEMRDVSGTIPPAAYLDCALVVFGCVKESGDILAQMCEHLAESLLVAHHPLIPDNFWKRFWATLSLVGEDAVAPFRSNAAALMSDLVGDQGLLHADASQQKAAIRSVASLMTSLPESTLGSTITALHEVLDMTRHDQLHPIEIAIFWAPKDKLVQELGTYSPEEVEDMKANRCKQQMPSEGAGPVGTSKPESASPTVMSKGSKGGSKVGGVKAGKSQIKRNDSAKTDMEIWREGKLAEEAEIREELASIARPIELGYRVIEALSSNAEYVQEHLEDVYKCLYPGLRSNLVCDGAFTALRALTSCTCEPLRNSCSESIAASLRFVARHDDASAPVPEFPQPLVTSLRGIFKACHVGGSEWHAPRPMPISSFNFCFPILHMALISSTDTERQDNAMSVLKLHADPQLHVARAQMLHALYSYLQRMPGRLDKVRTLMEQLCAGLHPEELENALQGLVNTSPLVRGATLHALPHVPAFAEARVPKSTSIASLLLLAKHDANEANAEAARGILEMYGHEIEEETIECLLGYLADVHDNIRASAAAALTEVVALHPHKLQSTLTKIFTAYIAASDDGQQRDGLALGLAELGPLLSERELPVVTTFLTSRAFADPDEGVRKRMVEAGVRLVDEQGKEHVGLLLPIFESFLDKKGTEDEQYDVVREGVVVLLGSIAKHLQAGDPKISEVVNMLLEVLSTPSENVQRSVSNCLTPLMSSVKDETADIIQRLLNIILQSESYASRRGAAFGLAGCVKGIGISSFRQHNILATLKEGVEDKTNPLSREGALYAIAALSERLGRLFEPYVVHVLPLLLSAFGDSVVHVRESAEYAASVIMGHLSGAGVKLVLPSVLKGLEERAWRTKQGSVLLLGAMSSCAPKQLSSALPTIVPHLTELLGDTHPKVQAAAKSALERVGAVIRNPEVQVLVPLMLKALSDPNTHTKTCLDTLHETVFQNSVDAPSLALIVPIIQRGLRERSHETRNKAAGIVGNMCALITDEKDILPYLDSLSPELKKILMDPTPSVRTTAAQALGSIVKGVGAENFEDVIPWLLKKLESDESAVERIGAAQGLSEVLAALGEGQIDEVMPDIMYGCRSSRATTREGYLGVFQFLPTAAGSQFESYLGQSLPIIIDGLADDTENVRDAALKAGRVYVDTYATTHMSFLLPEIEKGIYNDNDRIRACSVELLGNLIFRIAGTSGKVQFDQGSDDEGGSTDANDKAMIEVLGYDRRNQILSSIYIARSDSTPKVRQAAVHVWKTMVSNTPKALKEMMSTLVMSMIESLSCPASERRSNAGRALGDLVRKLGDRVLPEVIPILRTGLQDPDSNLRQGVCFGLSELMDAATKQQLIEFTDDLVPTVRDALCDEDEEVRTAAGAAFATLYKAVGTSLVEQIVPKLLRELEESDDALDGLRQLCTNSSVVDFLVPNLSRPPMTAPKSRAIQVLAGVCDDRAGEFIEKLLPPLLQAMADAELGESCSKGADSLVSMVADDESMEALMAEVIRGLTYGEPEVKASAARVARTMLAEHAAVLKHERKASLYQTLIGLADEESESVLKAVWDALDGLLNILGQDEQIVYIQYIRESISSLTERRRRANLRSGGARADAIELRGLCQPNALAPLFPLLLHGLLHGTSEQREFAADALGEMIEATSFGALKPSAVKITGPLIRIMGDRFPWQVKAAITQTLAIMIGKGGLVLKPFVPQLQSTFVKGLQESARTVRTRAAAALGKLMKINARVDPLLKELLKGLSSEDNAIKESMHLALMHVLKSGPRTISPDIQDKAFEALKQGLQHDNINVKISAAHAFAALGLHRYDEVSSMILDTAAHTDEKQRLGALVCVCYLIKLCTESILETQEEVERVLSVLVPMSSSEDEIVRGFFIKGAKSLILQQVARDQKPSMSECGPGFLRLLSDSSIEVKVDDIKAIKVRWFD
eukprot:scaffold1761_cov357-Prasinococcus_capsulatus_cf.AAC.17